MSSQKINQNIIHQIIAHQYDKLWDNQSSFFQIIENNIYKKILATTYIIIQTIKDGNITGILIILQIIK